MARHYSQTDSDFARISGLGEKTRREFGPIFMGEIGAHLPSVPRQIFADDSFGEAAAGWLSGFAGMFPKRKDLLDREARSKTALHNPIFCGRNADRGNHLACIGKSIEKSWLDCKSGYSNIGRIKNKRKQLGRVH